MKRVVVMLCSAIVVAACGGGSADQPVPMGEALFEEVVVGGKAGCTACHSIEAGDERVGPSLAGVGTSAAERIAGTSAATYLRDSITNPDAFLVDGYDAGIMPRGWDLTDAQIDSLVEYLLGLERIGDA